MRLIWRPILRYGSPVIHSISLQCSTIIIKISCIAAFAALLLTTTGGARVAEVPPAMEPISGVNTSTARDTATKDVLALNTSMFELYDNSLHIFDHNILAKHPVILGLSSGAGGRFIFYRPGTAPLEALSVPIPRQCRKIGGGTIAPSYRTTSRLWTRFSPIIPLNLEKFCVRRLDDIFQGDFERFYPPSAASFASQIERAVQ